MDYYTSIMCENCEEYIMSLNRTYIEHNGLPVVPVDIGIQQSYFCDNCLHTTVTGDLDSSDMEDI